MSASLQSAGLRKADELAARFAALPQVTAVALGGSQSSGAADAESDIDLYVYTEAEIPQTAQAALIEQSGGATRADLDLPYWGGVNMWIDAASGVTVDCIHFGAAWMEQQIAHALDQHRPSLGYSTCFARAVRSARLAGGVADAHPTALS
jgi:predicted nucleotidyltransferase